MGKIGVPVFCLAITLSATALCAADPPRYKLHPGQVLEYRGESGRYAASGWQNATDKRNDTLYVLKGDETTGWDVLLTQQWVGNAPDAQPRWTMVLCRLHNDGRLSGNSAFELGAYRHLIASLPPAGRTEVDTEPDDMGEWRRVTCKPQDDSPLLVMESIRHTPLDEPYGMSQTTTFDFDAERGLVVRSKVHSQMSNSAGYSKMELVEVSELALDQLQQLVHDAELFDAARRESAESGRLNNTVGKARAETMVNDMLTALRDARSRMDDGSPLAAPLDQMIQQRERSSEYYIEQAQQRDRIIAAPAPDWTLKDLHGNKHALRKLRGKVVVLDFWYRGCGWCVRAMPQMNELAERFEGQPVAIFGMNIDPNLDDALHIEKAMSLKYPSLRAEGIPEKYGVRGYPTLILIDRDGNVADIHVGWSATLYGDVAARIEQLLN